MIPKIIRKETCMRGKKRFGSIGRIVLFIILLPFLLMVTASVTQCAKTEKVERITQAHP